MKIVVLDGHASNPGDLSWEALEQLGNTVVYPRTAPNELLERVKDAEIVLTNKVCFTREILDKLPKLQYIGVLATGYNVIDVKAATEKGVIVTNIPAYSTESVVQMTFAHLLNMTNRVGHYARQNSEGVWSRQADFCYADTPLIELAGKTIGIVGLGNIGMRVAQVALCMGMDVFAYTSKPAATLPEGIQKTTLEGLFATSDVITLHCPLNDDTYNIINKVSIEKMKQGVLIINTGRGPLVDERSVAEALQSGKIGGYGADVLCEEPPRENNPLLSAPNAYITPHIAWASFEARQRLMDIAVSNVKAFIDNCPQNVVNP